MRASSPPKSCGRLLSSHETTPERPAVESPSAGLAGRPAPVAFLSVRTFARSSVRVMEPHKHVRNRDTTTIESACSIMSLLFSIVLCGLLVSSHPALSRLSADDHQFPQSAQEVWSRPMPHADATFLPLMPSQAPTLGRVMGGPDDGVAPPGAAPASSISALAPSLSPPVLLPISPPPLPRSPPPAMPPPPEIPTADDTDHHRGRFLSSVSSFSALQTAVAVRGRRSNAGP